MKSLALFKYFKRKKIKTLDDAIKFYNWWLAKKQKILFRPYTFVTCRYMSKRLVEYLGLSANKYVQVYLNAYLKATADLSEYYKISEKEALYKLNSIFPKIKDGLNKLSVSSVDKKNDS